MDSVLNNQQWSLCHKTKSNQTNRKGQNAASERQTDRDERLGHKTSIFDIIS